MSNWVSLVFLLYYIKHCIFKKSQGDKCPALRDPLHSRLYTFYLYRHSPTYLLCIRKDSRRIHFWLKDRPARLQPIISTEYKNMKKLEKYNYLKYTNPPPTIATLLLFSVIFSLLKLTLMNILQKTVSKMEQQKTCFINIKQHQLIV